MHSTPNCTNTWRPVVFAPRPRRYRGGKACRACRGIGCDAPPGVRNTEDRPSVSASRRLGVPAIRSAHAALRQAPWWKPALLVAIHRSAGRHAGATRLSPFRRVFLIGILFAAAGARCPVASGLAAGRQLASGALCRLLAVLSRKTMRAHIQRALFPRYHVNRELLSNVADGEAGGGTEHEHPGISGGCGGCGPGDEGCGWNGVPGQRTYACSRPTRRPYAISKKETLSGRRGKSEPPWPLGPPHRRRRALLCRCRR